MIVLSVGISIGNPGFQAATIGASTASKNDAKYAIISV
jgi:hypothetical protein